MPYVKKAARVRRTKSLPSYSRESVYECRNCGIRGRVVGRKFALRGRGRRYNFT